MRDFRTISDEDLAKLVSDTFGPKTGMHRMGRFCHVFMPGIERTASVEKTLASWNPTDHFDEGCPHCKPFLEEGAFLLWTVDGFFGLRFSPDGETYEMVGLQLRERETTPDPLGSSNKESE